MKSTPFFKCFLGFILLFTFKELDAQEIKAKKDVYTVVEKMPHYVGGDQALLKFIKSNLKYPKKALEEKTEGIVFVKFIINKKGKITDPKILVSVSPQIDEEALRIVKKMPKWEAGENQNTKVAVQFNLPIRFKLNTTTKNTN